MNSLYYGKRKNVIVDFIMCAKKFFYKRVFISNNEHLLTIINLKQKTMKNLFVTRIQCATGYLGDCGSVPAGHERSSTSSPSVFILRREKANLPPPEGDSRRTMATRENYILCDLCCLSRHGGMNLTKHMTLSNCQIIKLANWGFFPYLCARAAKKATAFIIKSSLLR
jgi:hypothetical protein